MKHLMHVLTALIFLSGPMAALAQNDTLATKGAAAFAAKNWQEAEAIYKQLVAADPDNLDYRQKLVGAQLMAGHYADTLASADQAIAYARKAIGGMTPPNAEKAKVALGSLITNRGNALLKQHKDDDAVKAFEEAAALDPNPGTAYFNICATMYNAAKMQQALAACDKAIATDGTKADAYFIKGSVLFGDSKIVNGKMVPPDGAVQALQKYLQLAPSGSQAADVRDMLKAAGQTIETTYKPRK